MEEKQPNNKGFKERIQNLKHRFRFFKNKYVFTFTAFLVFACFLDDHDLFTLISQNSKLNKIQTDRQVVELKLRETQFTLKQLNYSAALERYAREEKLFKKDDEDIFILSFE